MPKHLIVIGGGFAGMSAAAYLAASGRKVTLLEKNTTLGGRARQLQARGFTFDMGPSWYWMPEVFEAFFEDFGFRRADLYPLQRLDPSYRVVFEEGELDLSADYPTLKAQLEAIQPGSTARLDAFLHEARTKYELAMRDFIHLPNLSFLEYLRPSFLRALGKLSLFSNFRRYRRRFIPDGPVGQIMDFPILFLGGVAENTPALYSMMNYVDIGLGTWYPEGGMYRIVEGMRTVLGHVGVSIHTGAEVKGFAVEGGRVRGVKLEGETLPCDGVVAAGDYAAIEGMLPKHLRNYPPAYWERKTFAPSALLLYLGFDRRLPNLQHHNLFFDAPFAAHVEALYHRPAYPEKCLFYLCCPSKTDPTVAPQGAENVFVLVPLSTHLPPDGERERGLIRQVLQRLSARCGFDVQGHLVFRKKYNRNDFIADYHAFKGNAYGLANTLLQTGPLRPHLRNRKLRNLFYAGQLTVPGPGVPPAIISGKIAATLAASEIK